MTKLTKAVSFHSPKIATDTSDLAFKITILKPSLKGMPMKQRRLVRFLEEQKNV